MNQHWFLEQKHFLLLEFPREKNWLHYGEIERKGGEKIAHLIFYRFCNSSQTNIADLVVLTNRDYRLENSSTRSFRITLVVGLLRGASRVTSLHPCRSMVV